MTLRQRTISNGYFDYQIGRRVLPITLEQAARNMDQRHKLITLEDQHIEKKTLDDYYSYIKLSSDLKNPFDLFKNKDENYGVLRKHCH